MAGSLIGSSWWLFCRDAGLLPSGLLSPNLRRNIMYKDSQMDISQNQTTWTNFVQLIKYSSIVVFGSTLVLMFIFG